MLDPFPFRIVSLHSDNGNEFVKYTMEKLLNKLLVEYTKSRLRNARPTGCPRRAFRVQNNRKPFLRQAMTVSGMTITSAERHPAQTSDSHAQKNRSTAASFGRFTERCSTPSWWREVRSAS